MSDEFYASVEDAQRRLEYWMQQAKKQPVVVQKDDKTAGVIISFEDYGRLIRGDRKVVLTGEMDPEDIAAIENEEPFR